MSEVDNDSTYWIQIQLKAVLPTLAGTPLPIDLIAPSGQVKTVMLLLNANSETRFPVSEAGPYLIRAELPSGKWLTTTAVVPTTGQTIGEAILSLDPVIAPLAVPRSDSGGHKPEDNEEAATSSPTLLQLHKRTFSLLPDLQALTNAMVLSALGPRPSGLESTRRGVVDDPTGNYALIDGGFFDNWTSDTRITAFAIESLQQQYSDFPGALTLPTHPGTGSNPRDWKPLLTQVTLLPLGPLDDDIPKARALVLWPPAQREVRLTLLEDPRPDDYPDAPPLLAGCPKDNRFAATLFGYLRAGAADRARQMLPTWETQASDLLAGKLSDPIAATLGAYVLLRVGDNSHGDWMANLANWFPNLPDGALLNGWYRIRAGEAKEAPAWFHRALERGIPMFTEGVRLLHEGLSHLRDLYPEDASIKVDAARAYRLFSRMNPDSELTCLSLTDGALSVQFHNG